MRKGVPLFNGDFFQDLGLEAARVVDEDVYSWKIGASKIGGNLVNGGLNALRLTQVGVNGGGADAEIFEFADGLAGFVP